MGRDEVQIAIRPAGDEDRQFVRDLSARVFAEFGAYDDLLPTWMGAPGVRVVLAEQGGETVGFAMYSIEDPDGCVVDLAAIAVEPARQSRGVGTSLLRHVEQVARDLATAQTSAFVRLTVAEDNEAARRLFDRAGYVRVPGARARYPRGQISFDMLKRIELGPER